MSLTKYNMLIIGKNGDGRYETSLHIKHENPPPGADYSSWWNQNVEAPKRRHRWAPGFFTTSPCIDLWAGFPLSTVFLKGARQSWPPVSRTWQEERVEAQPGSRSHSPRSQDPAVSRAMISCHSSKGTRVRAMHLCAPSPITLPRPYLCWADL